MSGSATWLALPTDQQRRLMYARILAGQQPQNAGWGNTDGSASAPLPVLTAPSEGGALAQTGADFMDWRDKARAANVAAGLLDPDTGLPTQAGWQDAGRTIATGVGTSDIGQAGGLLGSVKAYHGSPHSFDAFDLSKIGTGEGAQAFGHGLYFAENEGVAKAYRDALSVPDDPQIKLDNKGLFEGDDWEDPAAQLALEHLNRAPNIAAARVQLESRAKYDPDYARSAQWFSDNAHRLSELEGSSGHMYEVNLDADPEHFLHWDKPISEQPDIMAKLPDSIRQEMLAAGEKSRSDWGDFGVGTNAADYPTGQSLYHHLSGSGRDAAAASETLRDLGIPGIKYLDAGSRNVPPTSYVIKAPSADFTSTTIDDPALAQKQLAGYKQQFPDAEIHEIPNDATHNYVVFDPATIQILRKYGIAGLMAGGGAAAAAGGNQGDTQ